MPYIRTGRHLETYELVTVSQGTSVIVMTVGYDRRGLQHVASVDCGVPVGDCALQTWVPRIVYKSGAVAGKIDLLFNSDGTVSLTHKYDIPPWLTASAEVSF